MKRIKLEDVLFDYSTPEYNEFGAKIDGWLMSYVYFQHYLQEKMPGYDIFITTNPLQEGFEIMNLFLRLRETINKQQILDVQVEEFQPDWQTFTLAILAIKIRERTEPRHKKELGIGYVDDSDF